MISFVITSTTSLFQKDSKHRQNDLPLVLRRPVEVAAESSRSLTRIFGQI